MANLVREDDKHEKIIRGLLKLPGNRRCINCGSLGPQYVCTNFSTFICTPCSGIHREFMHRIKSVSMAKFTAAEINELQSGGNDQARKVFLKDWSSDKNIMPDSSNPDKIREFIKLVYVQRRFTGENVPKQRFQENRSPRDNALEDRKTRPSPAQNRIDYAQTGGLAYGNRSFVRTVPTKRENGHSIDEAEDEDSQKNEAPLSPSAKNTASGSKRETVIRQLLQPPVEKRKNQLQRNYSSGSMSADHVRRPQVERSNSLSLKDLMADEKSSGKSPGEKTKPPPVTKSKSLMDLMTTTEQQQQQQEQPNTSMSTNFSSQNSLTATTKSSSTPCLIDLISGETVTARQGSTQYTSDLIDLISGSPDGQPEIKSNGSADPFASSFGLDLAAARTTLDPRIETKGPVPHSSSDFGFTGFTGGPVPNSSTSITVNMPPSITSDQGRNVPHSLSPGFSHGAAALLPGTFPETLPGFTVPPTVDFTLPQTFSMAQHQFDPSVVNQPTPYRGPGNLGAFGTNQSFGYNSYYYAQTPSTSTNPFDLTPISNSLYPPAAPPLSPHLSIPSIAVSYIRQVPSNYNEQSFSMEAPAMLHVSSGLMQQHHPASSTSGNPFA